MAIKIAEHKDVMLPVMNCYDGFITSHSIENIELIEDEKVKEFVGTYHPEHYLLNKDEQIAVGPLDVQPFLFEHKFQQARAMRKAKEVIKEVQEEFYQMTGRKYDLIEEYKMEDAELAIVVLNSTAGTSKEAVDRLREQGFKAGLIKPRVFRPFPGEEIANALKNVKAVAILDKADGLNGVGGPLFTDTTSAMLVNNVTAPKAVSYVYGIGGRDVRVEDIESVYKDLQEVATASEVKDPDRYLGLKGGRD